MGGTDDSSVYCEKHTAIALRNLLGSINIIETKIGQLEKGKGSDKYDLTVIGHEVIGDDIGNILSPTKGYYVEIGNVICRAFGKAPMELLGLIIENDSDEYSKYREMIRLLNSSKAVVVPFRHQTSFNGKLRGNKIEECRLVAIRWKANKETKKLEMKVTVETLISKEYYTRPIEEYGNTLWLKNYRVESEVEKRGSIAKQAIRMNNIGLVDTVRFVSEKDKSEIIVDNTYMYAKKGNSVFNENSVRVIGMWSGDVMTEGSMAKEFKLSEAYKAYEKAKESIAVHKKYIIPFGVGKINTIIV